MRQCPTHFAHGITPHDTECHAHVSKTQQNLHNRHCHQLGCPHALKGTDRYDDVSLLAPRNFIESGLALIDKPCAYAKDIALAVISILPR
jgi:hypothetical protein